MDPNAGTSIWEILKLPAIASALMSPIHCLFGLHIVRRGVIFIDLAVAQIALLGTVFAILQGKETGSLEAYFYSLGFALVGALIISLSKFKLNKVPHEAMIGIFFVVASAAAVIMLNATAHGMEEINESLSGNNVLYVMEHDIQKIGITYGIVLLALLALWRPITAISLKEPNAPSGTKAVLFDFLFYAMLAFVVASSVRVVGVLQVFTWLVMPAAAVFFWTSRMSRAVAFSLPLSIAASVTGLWLSAQNNWPTGSTMVVTMGVVVLLSYIVRLLVPLRSIEREGEPSSLGPPQSWP